MHHDRVTTACKSAISNTDVSGEQTHVGRNINRVRILVKTGFRVEKSGKWNRSVVMWTGKMQLFENDDVRSPTQDQKKRNNFPTFS